MIPKQELRLGNYFIDTVGAYCTPNTIQVVKSIDWEGVNKWEDMGASGICSFGKMMPIKLTPALLIKCGLKKHSEKYYNFEDIGFVFNIHLVVITIANISPGGLEDGSFGIDIPLESLHQLQNLFFALTGKELEVNLMHG